MTKRDYNEMALILQSAAGLGHDKEALRYVMERVGQWFEQDNPAFRMQQFRDACRLDAERNTALPANCETCQFRGHGFRERGLMERVHYRKCMNLSLPCDELGNYCGKYLRIEGI